MAYNPRYYVPITILSLVFAVAFDSMWGYIFRNGYYDALVHLRDVGPHLLPGSDTPLRRHYIGVELVDYWLTVLQAVFANIFDGSAPNLSIYAFYFAGQYVPIVTVTCIESYREGNSKNFALLYIPWLCIMQSIGFGIMMPVYCMTHLTTSKTAQIDMQRLDNLLRPRGDSALVALPVSVVFGYIAPAIAMSWPGFSPMLHQLLVAVWQVFPIWVGILQYCFRKLSTYFSAPHNSTSKRDRLNSGRSRALHNCYRFAFVLAMGTHILTLGLIGLGSWSPPVTYRSVFLPSFFSDGAQMANMVQGAHTVFQYDLYWGTFATLVWCAILHNNLRKESMTWTQWIRLLMEVVSYIVLAGPTGAIVMLMWSRDQMVLGRER